LIFDTSKFPPEQSVIKEIKMITPYERDYLSAVSKTLSTINTPPLIFACASRRVFLKESDIALKLEIFSYALYQIGLMLLSDYMQHTKDEYFPNDGTVRLHGKMMLERKQKEYFNALEILYGLSSTSAGFLALFEPKPPTKEEVDSSIALYESFLCHDFFDGIFDDFMPSVRVQEVIEARAKYKREGITLKPPPLPFETDSQESD